MAPVRARPPLSCWPNAAPYLGAAGFVVVSGLARGIDSTAHKGALASGTIAVLAGGLDHPYPPQNVKLHDLITQQGCRRQRSAAQRCGARTRFPAPQFHHLRLSRAVVVIEAALRSGSLITARAAADQGRDVMAAPGSPLDPRARGSNALIKQGATLIENADDIITAWAMARCRCGRCRLARCLMRAKSHPPRLGFRRKSRRCFGQRLCTPTT